MIQITLSFPDMNAARKALLELPENLFANVSDTPIAKVEKETASAKKPEAAKPAPAATQATAETSAAPEPKAENSEPAPASVDYPTLQKAVFQLAAESREAAAAVAASFGVKTFKELPQGQWADALAAVNAKLAELKSNG